MIFAGFSNLIVVACGGCSFPGIGSRLQYPGDIVWAWLIVISAISAIPLLALCGMRFSRRQPRPSKKRTAWLTVILTFIFMLSIANSSFGGMMICWVFLPLVIISIISLNTLPPLAILAIPLYMYAMVKIMQRFDRKLYWKSGRIWQRLESRRCK